MKKVKLLQKVLFVSLIIFSLLFSSFSSVFNANITAVAKTENSTPIWPMFHYNRQHTGRCPYDTSNNNGTLKWKYGTGDRIISSSPAIASDGTIYVGSDDCYFYAINPNGTLKWKYETGDEVWSSPAIASDGTIYVGSWDQCLYAIGTSQPSAPPNLQSKASASSITLTWTHSSQGTYPIAGYAIYRGTSSSGEESVPIATVGANTTTYIDKDVQYGTMYYYYVKAYDNQNPPNYSKPSNEVKAALLDTTPPTVTFDQGNSDIYMNTNSPILTGKVSEPCVLEINDTLVTVNKDLTFSVHLDNVTNNMPLAVYARSKAGISISFVRTIYVDTTPPLVTVSYPIDGSTVNTNSITVRGTATDKESGIASLTINGYDVTVNSDGSFSYTLTLTDLKSPSS